MVTKKKAYAAKRKRAESISQKAISFKKPTAATQQKQIAALAAKTAQNSRKLAGQLYTVHHWHRINGVVTATADAPYAVAQLNGLSQLTQIFGDSSEALGGKYTGRGITVDFNIKPGNDMSQIDMTAFIIRPRNQKVVVDAQISGAALPLALAANTDYVQTDGLCLMNLKRWHVDATYKMSTLPLQTNSPAPPGVWQGSQKVIRRKYTGKNVLKINNRVGTWNTGADWTVNPNQRQYLVIFNNNLSTAQSPRFSATVMVTGHTSE